MDDGLSYAMRRIEGFRLQNGLCLFSEGFPELILSILVACRVRNRCCGDVAPQCKAFQCCFPA